MIKHVKKKFLAGFHIMLILVIFVMSFPIGVIAETSTSYSDDVSLPEEYEDENPSFIEDISDSDNAGTLDLIDGGDDLPEGRIINNPPECTCGFELGPHIEGCELYQTPIYIEITDMIDVLPSLAEVMERDAVGIREIHNAILDISNAIDVRLGDDVADSNVCWAFEIELGEARILKYNEIYAFTSEYLVKNGLEPFAIPAATLDVSDGSRYVIGHTIVTKYKGFTTIVDGFVNAISDGLVVTGTVNHTYAAVGNEPDDAKIIEVLPRVTTHLYLDNLNISLENGTCIETTGANVTITLLDSTSNNLFVRGFYDGGGIYWPENTWNGGAIVKNGMDGSLTIRCERADEPDHMCVDSDPDRCGSLKAESERQHVAAIGSSYFGGVVSRYKKDGKKYTENGGFSNLYITGGIIIADAGHHTPGIGSMCGTTYLNYDSGHGSTPESLANPQSLRGQICENIQITGGRVYAYGGDGCAGIGSGWAGPVKSIHISDGAFVHAEGGTDEGWNSPGIGSGGTTSDDPNVIRSAGAFSVTDIQITGGKTIVEAIGSNHLQYNSNVLNPHRVNHVAGIGSGVAYNYINTSQNTILGPVSNVNAHPEEDWFSIIKQGTSKADAVYTNNTPNEENSPIATNMYYNLVYFTQISKTAQVNDGEIISGTSLNPIEVKAGDKIKYFIDTANWASEGGTYTIEDNIPEGLWLVYNSGSPDGMISRYNDDGSLTVLWTTSDSGPQQFSFQVIVAPLTEGKRVYKNRGSLIATANDTEIQIATTKTYHKQSVPIQISFKKVDYDEPNTVLPGAVFNLYKCTNVSHIDTPSNHEDPMNTSCKWGPDSLVGTELSGADGSITFNGIDTNDIYVLVETSAPENYRLPVIPTKNSNTNIIKVTVNASGSITYFSGRGEFESLASGTGVNCLIANKQMTTQLRVKKVIEGFDSMSPSQQSEFASHPFFITLSGGVHGSTALNHGEVTKDMLLEMTQSTMTVNVSELKIMEFDDNYAVRAEISHADGTSSTVYEDQIVINKGDDVTIIVTNTFEHSLFFKDWAAVTNTFNGKQYMP